MVCPVCYSEEINALDLFVFPDCARDTRSWCKPVNQFNVCETNLKNKKKSWEPTDRWITYDESRFEFILNSSKFLKVLDLY